MNYQYSKAVSSLLNRFSASRFHLFVPFCRYCANSSKLREQLNDDSIEIEKDTVKNDDLSTQSRDERLKNILANIKLKRTPLDEVIQNPAEQKRDQKSTGNEQFVSHTKLQARKEAINASKAFSEKVKGTKKKQIQNELAEMCEIALGAKDQLSDNKFGIDEEFMEELNQQNMEESYGNAYESVEEDVEQPMAKIVADTSKRESLSSTIDSTLLQTSKSADTVNSFSEFLKAPKTPPVRNKIPENKVESDKRGPSFSLMEAIAEHHARVQNTAENDVEKEGRARSPSPSKKRKRRRKNKNLIENEKQETTTARKYGSKFQESVELKEDESSSPGDNLSDLIRQFPLPGFDAKYSAEGWTRQRQETETRSDRGYDDYEEFFSDETIDAYTAGMSGDFGYDEEGRPDEHGDWIKNRMSSRRTGRRRARDDFSDRNISLYGQQRLNIFDANFMKSKTDSRLSADESMEKFGQSAWNVLLHKDTTSLFETPTRNGFEEMIKLTLQGKLWKFPIENEQGYEEEDNVPFHDHIFLEKFIQDFPKHPRIQTFMQVVCVGLSKNHKLTFTKKLAHLQMLKQYFEERFELLKTSAEFEESESID